MKIKLSVKDKNIVALCWLLEIVLNSVVTCKTSNPTKVPEYKKRMYQYISDMFVPAHNAVKELNNQFTEEIRKVFDEKFEDTLTNLTLGIVTLYETMTPKQMVKILKDAGIDKKQILECFKDTQEVSNG